jgi:outer membrane immunogenic protein
VTDNFDVGVGGRYWHITDGDGKVHFDVTVPGAQRQFASFDSERVGAFVQGSYRWAGPGPAAGSINDDYGAPTRVFSWTGLYAGINAGYAEGSEDARFVSDNLGGGFGGLIGTFVPSQMSLGDKGILGGGQIGYNWRASPSMVLGIEADMDWASISGVNSFTDSVFNALNTTAEKHIDSIGTLRARLGFLATPGLLLYGTGGLAWGDTSLKVTTIELGPFLNCTPNPVCRGESSGLAVGWTLGGGYELAIGHGITWKTEYLYADLGSRSATLSDPNLAPGNLYRGTTDFHEQIIRTGINFAFGGS